MNEYNYNFEISKNLKMFESAFDDVEIRRFEDRTGKVTDRIKVDFIYGPKSRILQDLKGQTDTVKLPIIAVTTTGMGRDDARIKNKMEDIVYRNENGSLVNIRPIPWNIEVQMTILSKFQQDMEQIIQNFAVFTNPYVVFSVREPKSERDLRVEVLWDGKVNLEYPAGAGDLPNNMPFRITGTANFTIKTWLFRTAQTAVKPICIIYDDIVVSDMFSCDYEQMALDTANNVTESYSISGIPQLRYVDNYYFRTTDSPIINVTGDGFKGITSLFLSASDPAMYDMSEYVAPDGSTFSGFAISAFNIISSQHLSFTVPPAGSFGFADIIAINDCGMGKLTTDANRCNRVENPYPTTDPEHYNWCVLQFPFLNGLIISNNLNDMGVIDPLEDIIIYDELPDRESIIDKIRELMIMGNLTVSDLV